MRRRIKPKIPNLWVLMDYTLFYLHELCKVGTTKIHIKDLKDGVYAELRKDGYETEGIWRAFQVAITICCTKGITRRDPHGYIHIVADCDKFREVMGVKG